MPTEKVHCGKDSMILHREGLHAGEKVGREKRNLSFMAGKEKKKSPAMQTAFQAVKSAMILQYHGTVAKISHSHMTEGGVAIITWLAPFCQQQKTERGFFYEENYLEGLERQWKHSMH